MRDGNRRLDFPNPMFTTRRKMRVDASQFAEDRRDTNGTESGMTPEQLRRQHEVRTQRSPVACLSQGCLLLRKGKGVLSVSGMVALQTGCTQQYTSTTAVASISYFDCDAGALYRR